MILWLGLSLIGFYGWAPTTSDCAEKYEACLRDSGGAKCIDQKVECNQKQFNNSGPKMVALGAEESFTLPAGWKLPKPVKTACNSKKNSLLETKGDFDGDGKDDIAKLLAKEKGKGRGVWVWLSSQKKTVIAAEIDSLDGKHDLGVTLAKPGKHQTACGKGYWECSPKETPVLNLKNFAIDFFTCESANRFLSWNKELQRFDENWMSD
jgi:hypothetical protein